MMRLSARMEYAYRALVDLAERGVGADPTRIGEIARRRNIPENFLLQVMILLRRAGFLESRRGKAGGYVLAREPEEITLLDVYRTVEGRGDDDPCPRQLSCEGSPKSCALAGVWREINDSAAKILSEITLAEALRRETSQESMYYI